jgi:hypothetical protein
MVSSVSSGVVLTTLGTIHPDHLELDVEQDGLEMDDIRIGVDLEVLSTAVGGPNGEPLSDNESHEGTPAPAYATFENTSPEVNPHMDDECGSIDIVIEKGLGRI